MIFISVQNIEGFRVCILLDSILSITETSNGCLIDTELETVEVSTSYDDVINIIRGVTLKQSLN
jgi:hypothetical protein